MFNYYTTGLFCNTVLVRPIYRAINSEYIFSVFIYFYISSLRNFIPQSKHNRRIDIPLVYILSKKCKFEILINAYTLNINNHPYPARK